MLSWTQGQTDHLWHIILLHFNLQSQMNDMLEEGSQGTVKVQSRVQQHRERIQPRQTVSWTRFDPK
jgi:hypothetical protein